MRVAVIPGDDTGCGTYRMILPANAVQKVRPDWKIELYRPGSVQLASGGGKIHAVRGLEDPHGVDVLVMQRIGTLAALQFTDWARDNGIAVVIDADDAMWAIDKANAAYRLWNSPKMNWRFLDQATLRADLVTVTTKTLADRYGKHGRVEVIGNHVPAEIFDYPNLRHEHDETVAVGWAGFVGTHPNDLQTCGDAVARALADTGAIARIIADAKGAARAWGLTEVEAISPQSLGRPYFSAMTKIDIALVPLEPSTFNKAKSWLKALEFSAMGVPVIASPTPDNKLLSEKLPILLADSPQDWYERITYLIDTPMDRLALGEKAREAARSLTIEDAGERWALAWERAYNRRRRLK